MAVLANGTKRQVDRPSVVVIPPGASEVVAMTPARLVRLLTTRSAPELAEMSVNGDNYQSPDGVAEYRAWPAAADSE